MQMKFMKHAFLPVGLVFAICAMASVCVAKDRTAENCTANRGIKPDIRIAACTRVLRETGAFGEFGDAAALSNRASAYAQKGAYNLALRDLDDAVRLVEIMGNKINEDPFGRMIAAGIFGNRGLLNLAINRQSEAAADFKQALLIEPSVQNYKEVLRRLDDSE